VSRRLRIVRAYVQPSAVQRAEAPKPKTDAKWPMLSTPIDPLETVLRSRAQSALTGLTFRDGSRVCDVPSIEQARDILAWYRPR
jgi:hypothetical protein